MITRLISLKSTIPAFIFMMLILAPCYANARTVNSVDPLYPSIIHWDGAEQGVVAEGSYLKINNTFYNVFYSGTCDGTWCPAGMVFADLAQCNQITGEVFMDENADPEPMPLFADLTGSEGQTIEHFATWPGSSVVWSVDSVDPLYPSVIFWDVLEHGAVTEGSYLKINGSYYHVLYSEVCAEPFCLPEQIGKVFTDLAQCNQITGELLMDENGVPEPMPLFADLTGMEGQPIEHFASWPDSGITWTIHNTYQGWPGIYSLIDWPFNHHAPLAEGDYVKVNGIFYYVIFSDNCDPMWPGPDGCPADRVLADLAQCNQVTGEVIMDDTLAPVPVPLPADMIGMEGQPIEHFTTWPGNNVTWSINNIYEGWPGYYSIIDWPFNMHDVLAEGDYLKIRDTYYYVTYSDLCDGIWCPAGMVIADLANCNQITGEVIMDDTLAPEPVPSPANLAGMEWESLELHTSIPPFIFEVNPSPYLQYEADINDLGEVVWVEEDHFGTRQVFSNQRGQITFDTYNHSQARINNLGEIFWVQDEDPGANTVNIYSSIRGKLTADMTSYINININDKGDVVWVEFDAFNGRNRIMGIINSSLVEVSTDPAADCYNPSINDLGEVVWEQFDMNTGALHIFSNTRGQLTFGGNDTSFMPLINNSGDVFFAAWDHDTLSQNIFGIIAGELTQLTFENWDSSFYFTVNDQGEIVWNAPDPVTALYQVFSSVRGKLVANLSLYYGHQLNNCGDFVFSTPSDEGVIYRFGSGEACIAPIDIDADLDGFTAGIDCLDSDPLVYPGAPEIPYNFVDDNCNGFSDEDDLDGDGYGIVEDCNDDDPLINPAVAEIIYNGIDENCNGMGDDDDLDNDGYPVATDCNDTTPWINPGAAETPYNGIDENCNGMGDDDDLDQDGYVLATDCDDTNAEINSSAAEIPYNAVDENCNGMEDDDDVDQDSYGIAVDCNDNDAAINPSAAEIPYNAIDENCNGMADDDDLDQDGYGIAEDCNDDDGSIYPGAPEIKHDGLDQDCNGYDLTIDIIKADYNSRRDKLTVEATSDLGSSAGLEVVGYGPMTWKRKKGNWVLSVKKAGGDPGSIIVSGIEGRETVATQ